MRRIAVYCGTGKGHGPSYIQKVYDLGRYFAEQSYGLVFGAELIGIMGTIQDGVLGHGGRAIDVVPRMLDGHETTSQHLTELILVDSMYERRNKMAGLAGTFVMALGGAGSLGEFLEVYSWAQIGIHEKPVAIYSINSFFNPLQAMIDRMAEEGFIDPKYRALAPLYDTKESLVESTLNFKPLGACSYD